MKFSFIAIALIAICSAFATKHKALVGTPSTYEVTDIDLDYLYTGEVVNLNDKGVYYGCDNSENPCTITIDPSFVDGQGRILQEDVSEGELDDTGVFYIINQTAK